MVTEMHSKISQVDQGLLKLTEAGKALMDKIEQEKAETITNLQGFVTEGRRRESGHGHERDPEEHYIYDFWVTR